MFGLLPTIGPTELVIILSLALIIIGPGKLAGVGKALGQSIREFRVATGTKDESNGESMSKDVH